MSDADTQVGQFVHHDLNTPDLDASAAFYGAIAGWTTQEFPVGDGVYRMFLNEGAGVGGLEQLAEGGHPHWVGYVRVSNIDLTLATATGAGATIVIPKTPIKPGADYAAFRDPWGAVCGIATDVEDPGRREFGNGEFSWAELATPDIDEALAFYLAVFPSWEAAEDVSMGPMGRYQLFKQKGAPEHKHLGGILVPPPGAPPTYWIHYITVADLAGTMAQIEEAGGKVLFPPTSVGGEDRITQCIDPQGTMFALHTSGPDPDDTETVLIEPS